jgi:hypothetical protein
VSSPIPLSLRVELFNLGRSAHLGSVLLKCSVRILSVAFRRHPLGAFDSAHDALHAAERGAVSRLLAIERGLRANDVSAI